MQEIKNIHQQVHPLRAVETWNQEVNRDAFVVQAASADFLTVQLETGSKAIPDSFPVLTFFTHIVVCHNDAGRNRVFYLKIFEDL